MFCCMSKLACDIDYHMQCRHASDRLCMALTKPSRPWSVLLKVLSLLQIRDTGAAAPVQTGELIDKQEASPKKRRKKASGAGDVEEGAPVAKRLKHDDAPAAGALVCMETQTPTAQTASTCTDISLTCKHDDQTVHHGLGSMSVVACLVQATMAAGAVPETRDGFEHAAAAAASAHLTGAVSSNTMRRAPTCCQM
jgi:hypothetical protein